MTPVHDFWLLDILDIFLVAVLFYRLLILVKGTRSAQMYVGLLVIVLIGIAAREFDLIAIRWISDSLKTVWLIAFVIIFQPELRHALAQFGRTRYFRSFLRGESYGVLGEVVRGVETLAERRQGALIALERNVGLRNFVDTGTRLDAKVTAELLVTLFSPGSPLHDGAVILREDTMIAASCILPLSTNPRAVGVLGTRHRAALGLSEESDAAVVVVSEETGGISIAYRGQMKRNLDEGQLRSDLVQIFRIRVPEESESGRSRSATTRIRPRGSDDTDRAGRTSRPVRCSTATGADEHRGPSGRTRVLALRIASEARGGGHRHRRHGARGVLSHEPSRRGNHPALERLLPGFRRWARDPSDARRQLVDLDGDGRNDAAVVLASEAGVTCTFVDLFAVLDKEAGPLTRGPASLGDRVKVDSIRVVDRAIKLHLLTHGPDDPLCCPTQPSVETYMLRADSLFRRPSEQP
jgi:diadenylate cyclase